MLSGALAEHGGELATSHAASALRRRVAVGPTSRDAWSRGSRCGVSVGGSCTAASPKRRRSWPTAARATKSCRVFHNESRQLPRDSMWATSVGGLLRL